MSEGPLARIMDVAMRRPRIPTSNGARRNRAKLHDDEQAGSTFDPEMLKPVEFSELDRGNLIRIAVAIEELNQTFKNTAKIEITNTAIDVLAGLKAVIVDLNRNVAALSAKRKRRAPGTQVQRIDA